MVDKQRILIVDDDENIAELISLYLMKECYDTKIVGDGESALKEVPVFKPNLILLDLMLPGMDGYQVCREIRTTSQVPIIMLSAKGEVFDKVLGLELGADDYMIKPFDSKELVARVKAKKCSISTSSAPGRTIASSTTATLWTCRRRNWSFYTSSLPLRIRSLPVNSCWTISGAMSISVTPGLLMSTSNVFARRSATTRTGHCPPSGESAINSR